jgi:hypothetical protein
VSEQGPAVPHQFDPVQQAIWDYDYCPTQRYFFSDDGDDIYLGDSGMKRMPIPRMKGQMRPIPTTVRQEPAPDMLRVPMEMQSMEKQSG